MRILIVHNFYQQPGGEDEVFRNECEMLRQDGQNVRAICISNAGIGGLAAKVRAALSSIYSYSSYRRIRKEIDSFRPDIVHVHNFFPLVSPSVFFACRRSGVPAVLTLHNYRIVCPTALLMHDGEVTERSLTHGPWWGVSKKVYRNSTLGTAALACSIALHRSLGTWTRRVSRFIALTEFAASKFERAGLPRRAIAVKPNFVDAPESLRGQTPAGFLFVGRLSREKGVCVLAEAMKREDVGGAFVRVAGVGPTQADLQGVRGVELLGHLEKQSVFREMLSAQALVVPSLWYEGFPMVIVEAYARGLPVIASRLGALAEVVEDGVTGLLFEPGCAEDLAQKMRWMIDNPERCIEMGRAARARYDSSYTQQINCMQLLKIYAAAISDSKKGISS